MTKTFQPAFAGGVLSPGMYARTDVSKYPIGLSDAQNFTLLPQGGAQNRAGTELVGGWDASTAPDHVVLLPFEVTLSDTLQLEFGDFVMRVMEDGAYVLDSSLAPQTVDAVTAADPAQLDMPDPGTAALFTVGDLVFFSDPNGGSKFHNHVLRVNAVVSDKITFEIIGGVTVDTSVGAWGTVGASATLSKIYTLVSPFAIADLPVLSYVQDVNDVYFAHRSYLRRRLVRTANDDWAFEVLTAEPKILPPAPANGTTTEHSILSAVVGPPGEVVIAPVGGLSPYKVGDGVVIDGITPGATNLNERQFTVTAVVVGANVNLTIVDENGDPVTPSSTTTTNGVLRSPGATAVQGTGTPGTTYGYVVAAIDAATGEESLPGVEFSADNDLSLLGNKNLLAWPTVVGAGRYVVYKGSQGVFGFIGSVTGTFFTDENIIADTEDNPQGAEDPFPTAGDQPGEVFFFEQRLGYASSTNFPSEVNLSRTNNLTNFNRAFIPRPDDAISFRMRTRRLNTINNVVAAEKLILFGGNAEWVVTGGDDNSFLTPSNPLVRPETFVGSAEGLGALLVDETVLFVQPDGRTLREFDLKRDDPSVDLTILARDLFRNRTIVSMAYARAPDSIVWVVFDDGSVATMTYLREHKMWGWTRQLFGGTDAVVRWVSVLSEGAIDVPYFVVSRTIDGQTITQVERLTDRAFADVSEAYFVDGGFKYEGTATDVLSGFLHLRGETVSVLVDGGVVEGLVVDETGTIDFAGATPPAERITVGLGYLAFIETLPIDFGAVPELGSMQGRFKALTQLSVLLERTRGIEAGRATPGAYMNQIKQYSGTSPQPLLTEMVDMEIAGDWEREAAVRVQQRFPLPAKINGLAPNWELGE